ncbi:deaminase [Roseivivax marinus]|uniref:deaminase n=1 Tax=Roseivivax marinus TaxID=1379903 RepID=UPI00273EA81D|nr:deaminase [Roseivivax marinus]
MTHAEMSALSDAARLGLAVEHSTLHVTTFPCHNCAKHVIAAGIKRVVYIEPYAKSRAYELHGDSITLNDQRDDRVIFQHFEGISPRRYRNIFEKGSRRDSNGNLQEWYNGEPTPQITDFGPSYVYNEAAFVSQQLS